MADSVYVDLSPVIRQLNNVQNQVGNVSNQVYNLQNDMNSKISGVRQELAVLRNEFVKMIEENRKAAALQRASTEIIRIRQELERDFGNYKEVRNTMVGILEASDLSLIRESTISRVTEELMVKTPRYWLAPVLIALSAWISNNEPLARKALNEALVRNEEKTCLVFALICRRNGRQSACFEWLSRYFSIQKATDMKNSIIAYIDAYTNGVFGIDKDNLCAEYIEQWMSQLAKANPNFQKEQVEYWKRDYLARTKGIAETYPVLKKTISDSEFGRIDNCIRRINAMETIASFFGNILTAEVDKKELARACDNELLKLVKNYDDDEAPLRDEEEYFNDVKIAKGDEAYAEAKKKQRELSRVDKKVDLAVRLSEAITSNSTENMSAKKTAIKFLSEYIKLALVDFYNEGIESFPEQVTLSFDNWQGVTSDGSNETELADSYKEKVERYRKEQEALIQAQIAQNNKKTIGGVIGIILAALGILFIVIRSVAGGAGLFLGLGIILLLVGAIMAIAFFAVKSSKKKALLAQLNQMNNNQDKRIQNGKGIINVCCSNMMEIASIVQTFNFNDEYDHLLLVEGTNER